MELDAETLDRILAMHTVSILSQVSAMIGERSQPIGREGIIQGYDPTDGTVEVIFLDGAAIITGPQGDGDTPPTERRVPLLVTHHGDQFGPVGGERCVMVPTQSGYAALIIYDDDDSPNAPAGERWITHRNASGVVDSIVKLTNDGPTTGDGLSGLHTGGGALTKNSTAGGHSDTFNDTAKSIVRQSAGGHTDTFTDAVGGGTIIRETAGGAQHIMDDVAEEVASLAAKVSLGARASAMTSVNAAVNQSHISTYDSSLQAAKLLDYIKFANLLNTAGTITSGQLVTILATLVAGFTHGTGGLSSLGSPIVKLS